MSNLDETKKNHKLNVYNNFLPSFCWVFLTVSNSENNSYKQKIICKHFNYVLFFLPLKYQKTILKKLSN